jgi:AmmeMemoRadiSam system protein B
MKFNILTLIFTVILSCFGVCMSRETGKISGLNVRQLVDTIGFAQYSWQMDTIMARLNRKGWKRTEDAPWKLAVCPHDDYTYVGELYPGILQNMKAPNLILIGVAHKAASLGIEDSLVFDKFTFWKGPWKNVPVSPAREEIYSLLRGKCATISDTLHAVEHSLESMIPFLQYFNRDLSIVPILVPAMDPGRMQDCAKALADAIRIVAGRHGWEWGRDFAIVVTTDAVHYGNEDWGGKDLAYFGCDSMGNMKALEHEKEIIRNCLSGTITPENIKLFSTYTLNPDNYKEYKWTWCGRYSVPVTLLTSYYLNNSQPLTGELVGYSTSILHDHIPVDDIGMGTTAIATNCHWVGYASIGYR